MSLDQRETRLRMLAVGAHPDDVEIGAGALLVKARDLGHEVWLLVLTDEPPNGAARRAESRRAAAELGVPGDRVLFAGLRDGHLRADAESVHRVREVVLGRMRPDLVVTHTTADSHNDHVEANRAAHAAFRGCAFLHFSIHVSAEVDRFQPRVFVDVAADRRQAKDRALYQHRSQADRIGRRDLAKYEAKLGGLAGLAHAEGFETGLQYGAVDVVRRTLALSDSPFHRFWLPVVRDGMVTLLYESPDPRAGGQALVHQYAARDRLRQAFADQWVPASPLREQYGNTDQALAVARQGSVVVTGAAVTNRVIRECQPLLALDAASRGTSGDRALGCVARVPNPFAAGEHLVGVAGVTDFATRVGVEFLADPSRSAGLAAEFDREPYLWVSYSVRRSTGELTVLDLRPAVAAS